MAVPPWLWIVATLLAAGGQTLRNAMQRDLVDTVGTAGATYVRFLFGFPFAILFLFLTAMATHASPAFPTLAAFGWTVVGALAQVMATALMLAAMRERSFVVTTAYTKTEPVQVALFGLVFLGDRLPRLAIAAILIATAGVMVMSWPSRTKAEPDGATSWQPAILGLLAATCFAFSAIGYRAGILALENPNFLIAATSILVLGLFIQTLAISAYLTLLDRPLLTALLAAWRRSLFAGFIGAFASQFWFIAFAVDTAARVRTLGLVEVIFAQIVTRRMFAQGTSAREIAGMAMIALGVVILLNT